MTPTTSSNFFLISIKHLRCLLLRTLTLPIDLRQFPRKVHQSTTHMYNHQLLTCLFPKIFTYLKFHASHQLRPVMKVMASMSKAKKEEVPLIGFQQDLD